jgi:exonuclease III
LYESWTNSKSVISLNGYKSHNFYRKFQNRRARRNSGGIILLYKDHLKDGINIIKNHHDTIIWIKLDHLFFNTAEDVYLCGAYIWGEESPANNFVDIDLFDTIEHDISVFNSLGCVVLCGDLNSRIGNKCDFIPFDCINNILDDPDYDPDCTPVRASVDNVQNSNGIKLIDLCKSTSLRIANGRIFNTSNYTFCSNNGCSVIDYLLMNERHFSLINDFTIDPFNEWSDHAPLRFSLACPKSVQNDNPQYEIKCKWSDENTELFRSGIIGHLPRFNNIVQNIDVSCRDSIDKTVEDFSEIVRSVANPLFSRCYFVNNKPFFHKNTVLKNADWFNDACNSARESYLQALRLFNSDQNNANRVLLMERKSTYNKKYL